MVIYPNGSFATQDDLPNTNFADEEYKDIVLVLDDNSEIGQEILLGGSFKTILEGDKVINIAMTSPLETLQPPSLEERLQMAEDTLMYLLMGGM